MSDPAKTIVELREVDFVYHSGVHALNHVTYDVYEGDFLSIIGPNGGGKSTLLNVLLGILTPNHGSVRLFGQPISPSSLSRVGYVPQKTAGMDVNFPSTVYETVLLGRVPRAGLFHRFNKEDHLKAEKVLELLGLSELRDRKIGQLSGGQTQRVLVAKALAGEPELLILDEPTSGVDSPSRTEFYKALKMLNKEKKITIILASHDISVVTRLANRVMCLNGSLFFCGPIGELSDQVFHQVYDHPVELMKHGDHP